MRSPQEWEYLTQGATDTYRDIDSLGNIRQPSVEERRLKSCRFPDGFPARGTPNWWALRRRYEELLARDQRRARAGDTWAADDRELAEVCKTIPLESDGGEEVGPAQRRYEAINPQTGLHRMLSPALRMLRERNPAAFERISAEAKRLQSLGRPTRQVMASASKSMP